MATHSACWSTLLARMPCLHSMRPARMRFAFALCLCALPLRFGFEATRPYGHNPAQHNLTSANARVRHWCVAASQTCQHRLSLVRRLLSAAKLGPLRIRRLLAWCVCFRQLIGLQRHVGSRGIERASIERCVGIYLQAKKPLQIGYFVLHPPIPIMPGETFRT